MRRRTLAAILAASLALGSGACSDRTPASRDDDTVPAAPTDGRPERVALGADAAASAGIATAAAERAEASVEVDAFGRVLDPLPLVEALHARRAARAAATLARAELERVARLNRDDQNASTRDLESARAAADKAAADLATASARLTVGWGALADQDDTLGDELASGRRALVRVDLPAGVVVTPPPATVTITHAPDGKAPRAARVLGPAASVDPLVQGESWIALVADDPPQPGAVLAVRVPRDAMPVAGVRVPASAIVWVDAAPAVYVAAAPGEYERRAVTLGPRVDDHWIVTSGLAPDEPVVVAGAARLVSSELVGRAADAD